jgi:chemotaxis signal transduction protein
MILLETETDLTEEARDNGIRSHEESVALRVDSTGKILSVPKENILPRPAHIEHDFVNGLVRVDDGYLVLLCIRRLIDSILKESSAVVPAV